MLRLALALSLAASAVAPLAWAAPDATARLALPPWPLAPDGELVAAPPGVPLAATGGVVAPVAPGLWRVVPDRGAVQVVLRAGEEEVTAPVAPPPGKLTLTWSPARPVKGRDAVVQVEVALVGADGQAAAEGGLPRLLASAGRLRGLERAGPGRWRASLDLPPSRPPEVVALFATLPRCPTCADPEAEGWARLPLAAAIDLPGETDPGVTTHVEVGGTVFGPVRADRAGRFRLPVIVPPGASRAIARSVNALGNERRKPIDLGLPPAPRLACVASPDRLPADGRSRSSITCLAHLPGGEPAAGARVKLAAGRGALADVRREGDLTRAEYTAPLGGAGPVEVEATWREAGGAGRAVARLDLVTGPPARIDWALSREPLVPGEGADAAAEARDGGGDVLGSARAGGGRGAALAAGRFVAREVLGDGLDPIVLDFALPTAEAGEAATLSLRRAGAEWVAEVRSLHGGPVRGVALSFGGGARAVTDERGEARAPASGATEQVRGPEGLRAAGWAWAPPPAAPFSVSRQVLVALRPPGAVDVEAAFDGRFVTWTVRDPSGAPQAARRVGLRAGSVTLGPVERLAAGGRCAVLGGRGPVAVVDEDSGVAAIVVVP